MRAGKMIKKIKLIECYPKQREIWESADKWPFTVVCTGRQVGKSSVATAKAFSWAMQERGCSVGFFMPTYKQVDQNLNKILTGYSKVIRFLKAEVNKTRKTIYFPLTQSWIYFKSTESEESCRGGTYDHLIIDEAADVKDDVWEAIIRPTAAAKGKTHLILSTPKGRNWFYEMYMLGEGLDEKQKDGINSIRFSSITSPYINKDELERSQRQMREALFRQEYLAEFVDGASLCFNGLDRCLYNPMEIMNRQKGATQVYFGIDLGSTVDYTWCIILDQNGTVIDKMKCQGNWNDIKDKIHGFLTKWSKFKPIGFIERNGVGAPITDHFIAKPPANTTIWPWVTGNKNKSSIMESLIMDVEKGNIKIPKWDDLVRELLAMEVWWKNGRCFYGAPAGEHDDGVIALALAREAFRRGQQPNKFLTGMGR